MAVSKTIELTAGSPKGFEDAIAQALNKASQTVRNIERAWVQEQYVAVRDDKVYEYRVNMRVTFMLDDEAPAGRKRSGGR